MAAVSYKKENTRVKLKMLLVQRMVFQAYFENYKTLEKKFFFILMEHIRLNNKNSCKKLSY